MPWPAVYPTAAPATAPTGPKTTSPVSVPMAVFATRPAHAEVVERARLTAIAPTEIMLFMTSPTIRPAGTCKPRKFGSVRARRLKHFLSREVLRPATKALTLSPSGWALTRKEGSLHSWFDFDLEEIDGRGHSHPRIS
jgi:hypothetical protein